MNNLRDLNDAELEAVSGGMDCSAAIVVARIYQSTGNVFKGLGDYVGAAEYYNMARGILVGGCN